MRAGMPAQAGAAVGYPGLRSHRQHALMQRLSNADYGCGGILTLDLGSQKVGAPSLLRMCLVKDAIDQQRLQPAGTTYSNLHLQCAVHLRLSQHFRNLRRMSMQLSPYTDGQRDLASLLQPVP